MQKQSPSTSPVSRRIEHLLRLQPWPRDIERWIRDHPDDALEAVGQTLERLARSEDVPPAVRGRVVAGDDARTGEATLTVTEAARQLQVTRQTLYAWIRTGKVLAWRTSKPGYHIPAEQILGPEQFVPDIDRVLAVIPEPRTAWRFLTEESPYFEEPARPIDRLKAGATERVVEAARLHGEATT